ncbi:MAG: hypothetical protein HYZ50_15120 [Deltaproteobacteria bacterium]|nr:hypothetical protein [Deltaproteobacteria bacterium]
MSSERKTYHRRSIRLPGYDYRQSGMYFVTIGTWERQSLFGAVVGGEMRLSEYGQIVKEEWLRTLLLRPGVDLDEFVVMPNHLHGILVLPAENVRSVGAHSCAPLPQQRLYRQPRSLGSLLAGFKSAATKRINDLRHMLGMPLWQRNYYEHIIRNEDELHHVREYIQTNPLRWELDRENPAKLGEDEFDQWLDLGRERSRR